jgi:hypothetical protein
VANLTNQIKQLQSTEEDEAELILKTALRVADSRYACSKPEGKLELMNPEEVDSTDVIVRMAEYGQWASYFSTMAAKYRAAADYLEGIYETFTKQYIVTSSVESSDRKKECAAKVKYSPIERARQKAKAKSADFSSKHEAATLQYQLCSRIITFRGDELRSSK